ncbi:hypothetical protein CYMTET_56372 [Cymbomonas tetramitiformis]|uniref:Methylenetetrahydrofolate reductase (NAD(P)H) n=1 Tax=Cymbomonas tetramitiformis TaxID=36881 RepID=A0AAE0BB19_9CHLO|nr:hypothetical protein CYMTET_56372 [Cymbomonas tetramitiformis]
MRSKFGDQILAMAAGAAQKNNCQSIGPNERPLHEELWNLGKFDSMLYPDLPDLSDNPDNSKDPVPPLSAQEKQSTTYESCAPQQHPAPMLKVRTVAAQLRSPSTLQKRLLSAVHYEGAKGLLLVSGGHPGRTPSAVPQLSDCFTLLEAAQRLQREGQLPPGIPLGVVANPLRERADYLHRKVEAGAQVVWTQPPLLPDAFDNWWEDVSKRGIPDEVPIIMGVAFPTSVRAMQMWLQLTNSDATQEGRHVLDQWNKASEAEDFANWRRNWIMEQASRVASCKGNAGDHWMPITPAGYRDAIQMMRTAGQMSG